MIPKIPNLRLRCWLGRIAPAGALLSYAKMISEAECIQALRLLIERASRDELEKAQGAILQFALSQPDTPARSAALDKLRAALATICHPEKLQPLQNGFYLVVDAMIERTGAAVAAT